MTELNLKGTKNGLIPKEWELVSLGNFITHKKGFAFKSQWFKDFGNPVVKVKDLTSDSIDMEHCVFLDIEKSKEFDDVKLDENDILIATVGSWPTNPESVVGKVVKVPKKSSGAFLNQNAVRIRTKNNELLNQIYTFYRLKNKDFQNYLISGAQGSANQASITLNDIFGFEFYLPPIKEQENIAKLFYSIDKKIEINQKMNQTLEEIGQAIFKYFFVHFEFPNEEGKPYKSSGGEMVDSELGKIPKGWEVQEIGTIIETTGGGTPSTKKEEYWKNGDIQWFSPRDITANRQMFISNSEKRINSLGLEKSSARLFQPYSLMMTSRATVGELSINTIKASTNQGFITCIPNERLSTFYLYYWIKMNKEYIISLASGSTFREISKSTFRSLKVVIPDGNVLKSYDSLLEPIFNQIQTLQSQNENLSQIRDSLLPKIMSGKIRVIQ
ncbi:MAG: restriction endonuclease subunit S [Methanobacteriaceae archaeon]|nr:restriction endonuclease subunit S [Methanobacteriaceae archaeon]MDO9626004.1 restriction endonuclease subunit S [Methanobacteriaceae archaeon]